MFKSDNQIIIDALDSGNDDLIIDIMYRKVLPKIKSYVAKNNGNQEDAMDVFQEGIMNFYEQVQLKKIKREFDIKGYVYTICRNQWIALQRKNKLKTNPIESVKEEYYKDENNFETTILNSESESTLLNLLQNIGEECKGILNDIFFLGKSQKEIAEKRAYSSEEALKMKAYRCRKKLHELIKSNEGLEELLRF